MSIMVYVARIYQYIKNQKGNDVMLIETYLLEQFEAVCGDAAQEERLTVSITVNQCQKSLHVFSLAFICLVLSRCFSCFAR